MMRAVICRGLALALWLVTASAGSAAAPPENQHEDGSAIERFTERLKALGKRTADVKAWKAHRDAGRKAERQQDLREAERQFAAAAREAERFSPKDERIGETLDDWGRVVFHQRKFRQAQRIFEVLVVFREQTWGTNHFSLVPALVQAGQSASFVGQNDVAEKAYRRALAIAELRLGAYHMQVGQIWGILGQGYTIAGKTKEAEHALKQALAILEAPKSRVEANDWGLSRYVQPASHLGAAGVLNDLALLYRRQDRPAEAEAAFQKALNNYEREVGKKSEGAALVLDNLGDFYREQKKFPQAEASLARALAIREKLLGPDHLLVADTLQKMALLNIDLGRSAEAALLGKRAQAIRSQLNGGLH